MDGVVITGRGVVSPLGNDVPSLVAGLMSNQVAVRPAPWARGDGPFAWWTAVRGFRPLDWMDERVEAGTDLYAQFALAAAQQAVTESGLSDLHPRRTAVVHGTSMGGMRALLKGQHQLERSGPEAIDRKTVIQIWPNMAAAQIVMRYGLLAAIRGEGRWRGSVVAGERGFRGGSGCGWVVCDDTVSVSVWVGPPRDLFAKLGEGREVLGGTVAHGRQQRGCCGGASR